MPQQTKQTNEKKIKKLENELKTEVRDRQEAEKEVEAISGLLACKGDVIEQKNKIIKDSEKVIFERERLLGELSQSIITLEVSVRDYEGKITTLEEELKKKEAEKDELMWVVVQWMNE